MQRKRDKDKHMMVCNHPKSRYNRGLVARPHRNGEEGPELKVRQMFLSWVDWLYETCIISKKLRSFKYVLYHALQKEQKEE